MRKSLLFLCLLLVSCGLMAANPSGPLNAVVCIEATTYRPNYFLPWHSGSQQRGSGSGVVISGRRILTNAHNVADATYITVRKESADEKYNAKVLYVDHDCDLALIEVEDKSFFNDIMPFELGETPPLQTTVIAAGFPIGGDGLSITKGVISRIEVHPYTHSFHNLLAAQLDAAINPGNSGGPVLCDGKVVGIAFQGNKEGEGLGYMIPTEIIRHFLRDVEDKRVDGFGVIGFRYGRLENPDARRFLKMGEKDTGVRITWVSKANASYLKADDVLLAVDGTKVANNGNIRIASGEARLFTTLVTQKQIGESVSLTILRNGKRIEVKLPVRKGEYLCKEFLYDKLPDYYISGGFVFTTLSLSYLDEWRRKAPPEALSHKILEEKEDPAEEVIVVSIVLADRLNAGYQDDVFAEQLKTVNGKKIKNLRELISFVENSKDEFITMTFGQNDHPVTLDLAKMRAATPRILQRYRIPADRSKSLQMPEVDLNILPRIGHK